LTCRSVARRDAADRPPEEGDGEDSEHVEQAGELVALGEEQAAEDGGEEAEQAEVIPLQHVAQDAGQDGAGLAAGCVVGPHDGPPPSLRTVRYSAAGRTGKRCGGGGTW